MFLFLNKILNCCKSCRHLIPHFYMLWILCEVKGGWWDWWGWIEYIVENCKWFSFTYNTRIDDNEQPKIE